ncbi:Retrotransposon gag domain-containing 1 [Gossypium australe]|uniref:Retrotransposon gag domain-containing 1 n=1 Tax=Gossypium australe TaxID=47621 RepID=A0A5B6WU58_9ROSI|nr:Retrotransposon gag domain-containing 1 [Gossypium australe]
MLDPSTLSYSSTRSSSSSRAEEFWASKDDDSERAEFWLENTIRVFDELSCTLEECLKCAVSHLRDSTYRWWNTLVLVVPRERQGHMSVTDYEWEFVRLNKYARECVSTEAVMCKRFEDGLNEDIRLYIEPVKPKSWLKRR